MGISGRLIAVFAYEAAGAVPKVLYLDYDADKALKVLGAAKNKGYFEIRMCRNIDAGWVSRFRGEPIPV